MKKLENIFENQTITHLAQQYTRAPFQINKLHESDAELIMLDGDDTKYLAVSIDTVADEISEGLYRNPFTMGWVTVMASFSDLAAVGADPIGIVTAVSLETSRDKLFCSNIARGMEKACRQLGTFILGGDLNRTQSISLTGCAIGAVPREKALTRIGCQKGDVIFLSNHVGSGNALGLARKTHLPEDVFPETEYRPIARIKESRVIRKYASCCMDTSDGLFITIDQLIRLNNLGFSIKADWESVLKKEVFQLCTKMNIPYWFMAAGIHGEFELVFTVPANNAASFLAEAYSMDFFPISLGKTTNAPDFEIRQDAGNSPKIDMAPLRNLWDKQAGDIRHIIEQHHFWGKKWGLN